MIEFVQVRRFLFKLFTTILIFCICHLVFELVTNSKELFSTENEESRFKRSVEDGKEEVLLDLPGHNLDKEQFIRKKRMNTTSRRQFVATNEWQSIDSDHIVPSGLHYRINMATGKKEAKLLNGKVNRSKELLPVAKDKDPLDSPMNGELHSHDPLSLNSKLNKLQTEFEKFKFDEKNVEPNKEKDLKNWRTIDEIKKEFEEANIKLTSDSENLHALLERYKRTTSDEEKITILKDLEFIVHQYDVSSDFVKMGGLTVLKADFLNRNPEIQSLIALVLGSSSSSNPPVKIAILKAGLFDSLIAKLSSQDDLKLNLKTIYAISAIVRQFPHAQKQLIEQGGLKVFKRFFESNRNSSTVPPVALATTGNSTDLVKIQTKIISLLSDLKEEHEFAADELIALRKPNSTGRSKELSDLEEKIKQYNAVNLETNFVGEGYCLILPKNLNNSTLDVREKVLKAMYSFRSACKGDFKRLNMSDLLRIQDVLRRTAENEKSDSPDDDYYQNLIQLTQNLIDYLNL